MKIKDLFLGLLMCISWSSDYIFTKHALEIFSPIFFSSIRFFLVGVMILPTVKRFPPRIWTLILISFPLVVLVFGAIDIGIKLNSSLTVTSIVFQFHIVTSIVAAYFFLKETLTKKQIIGIIVAFLGFVLVVVSNSVSNPLEIFKNLFSKNNLELYFNKNNILSLMFLGVAVFCWPIYAISSKKLARAGVYEKEIIGWTALFGSFFGIITSFIFEKNQISSVKMASFVDLSYFFYAAFFGVLLPHLILHYLIRFYDVSKASIFSFLVPLFTAIGGVFFFHEKINAILVCGGILLIFGVYITQFSSKKNLKNKNHDGESIILQ